MKKYQKGFAPVLILGLVVVSAAVLFFIYKNFGVSKTNVTNSSPSSFPVATLVPTPSESSEILNWKTYTNAKYRYSLMIPSDWTTSTTDHAIDSQLVPGQKVSMTTLKNDKTTLEVFFEGEFDHGYMPWKEESSEDILLGNKIAKKVTLTMQGNPNKWITITIPNFHYFRIEIQGPTEDLETVDQILATFKFTN